MLPAEASRIVQRLHTLAPSAGVFLFLLIKQGRRHCALSNNRDLKQQTIVEIKDRFQRAGSVILVEYRGINVEDVTNLRRQFRAADVEYVVLKNTLVKRALGELNIDGLDSLLEGPSAFAFSYKDPVAPAKVIKDFIDKTKNEHIKVKGGLVDGQVIDVKGVQALANLPPREVLIAQLMGSLNAPATNLVGVLSATLRSLVYAIDAIRKQKEGPA